MKVAIQLYGHLRTFELCYKKLHEYLIYPYQCDVFIHTWDGLDHTTQTWHRFRMTGGYTPEEIREKVEDCYHPQKHIVERQEPQEEGCIVAQHKCISKYGIRAMLHSMQQVNKLREEYEEETKRQYDYIVMVRPDVELWTPLELSSYIEDTEIEKARDSFYFGGFYKQKRILNNWQAIGGSDVLFFAPRSVMSKIFAHTDDMVQNCTDQKVAGYGPEYAFLYTIEKLGMHLQFIDYLWGDKYTVLRGEVVHSRVSGKGSVVTSVSVEKKKKWYRHIIRLHLRRHRLELIFLTMLPFNIVDFELHFHTWFTVYLCIGKMST